MCNLSSYNTGRHIIIYFIKLYVLKNYLFYFTILTLNKVCMKSWQRMGQIDRI